RVTRHNGNRSARQRNQGTRLLPMHTPRDERMPMKNDTPPKTAARKRERDARLGTRSDLPDAATRDIGAALNALLADAFALYVKTKNFHWHMSGPHFRDYHLLLDEQADQIYASADPLAERVRKLGAKTLHSIGEIARLSSIKDNDAEFVSPGDMLRELMADNKTVIKNMRAAHEIADKHDDV